MNGMMKTPVNMPEQARNVPVYGGTGGILAHYGC